MKNIAVIGLGSIAARHRRNLKLLFPQALIYAISASGRNLTYPVSDCDRIASSIEQLTGLVDMAIIASPATKHAEHAIPFIAANIPVLIEKPIVASVEDAQRLIEASRKYKTPVAVGYCLRYMPSARMTQQALAKGLAGQLLNANICIGQYLPDWRATKDYRDSVSVSKFLGGGALLELSHEFDYTRWMLGELRIHNAIIRNSGTLNIEVEDLVDVVAMTNQQAVIHLHLDFLQRKAYRHCNFIGTKGRIEWDLILNQVLLHTEEGTETLYSDVAYDKNEMYLDMLRDFIQFIVGRPHQCILVNDAVATIELIEKIKNVAG
ncbi:gfo/Idh/MocA family oxidoreductase [Salmonella enterica]|uniref:Gfo/Idh/MocA family oxidoreductase n=1 Tax=Salmonella diarizonae TaxID=59204 RepID=A0A6Y1WCL3_SALDZ|nr:gfo/Idh/MocA family oxidoreductase [Salmonella enterica]HAB4100745.1 gfo/Idh/MocA family oxidoreductase [Salmonella enterica subsp. diarizonae]HAB4457794.1 gfo/Idh/MocA family oxidoreductase [Salmonella enterica subsp. diarizonae]HDC2601151.1 Gfo/Idh/MocA family oxidoreductase [Salmonella enterica]